MRVLSCSFLPACCTLFTKNATRIILVSEEEERRGKKKRSRRSRIDFGDEFTDVRSEKAVAVESGNKGRRRRRGRTRRMVEATRALIRLSRGASHTDMAGYANKTQGRQNRAESRYHYLSPCGAGKKGIPPRPTRIPPANKDPHAEICMGIADVLRAYPGGSGPRLMKIGFEPRNSRAPSRGKVRKPTRSSLRDVT